MSHRASFMCFGASAGFTVDGLFRALTNPQNLQLWLPMIGSAVTTIVGLWISERRELARAALEREKDAREARREQYLLDREARRDQAQADAIQEFRIDRLRRLGDLPPANPDSQ